MGNLDASQLCNGERLRVELLGRSTIDVRIMIGSAENEYDLISGTPISLIFLCNIKLSLYPMKASV